MGIRIRIPANMRTLAGNNHSLEIEGETVGQAMQRLVQDYPDLRARILDDNGQLQSFVNVFLRDQSVRDLQGLETNLSEDDELIIIPALAGG